MVLVVVSGGRYEGAVMRFEESRHSECRAIPQVATGDLHAHGQSVGGGTEGDRGGGKIGIQRKPRPLKNVGVGTLDAVNGDDPCLHIRMMIVFVIRK